VLPVAASAQQARISGTVVDDDGLPVELANVGVSGRATGAFTDARGRYSLTVQAGDSVALVFSCIGYNPTRRIVPKVTGDMNVSVTLRAATYEIGSVTVTERRVDPVMNRIETSGQRLAVDATGGSIESLIVTAGTGVASSNELSTQYSVRGGNYNENMVYVNGVEVYRPILIRSGQQEGLSFINPDLTAEVKFSSGGFEARYGDKMSSALDVTYKKPDRTEGGFTASMLGGSVFLGSASGRFSQITGVRYKRGTTLLKTLDTKGDYEPSAFDVQTGINYDFSDRLKLSILGNYSDNTYDFYPGSRFTAWGSFSEQEHFEVFYEGAERDRYRTLFGSAALTYSVNPHADITLQVSATGMSEQENYDIQGEYWISNVQGENKAKTGIGLFIEHARNQLQSSVANASIGGRIGVNRHTVSWSASVQKENISDRIREWQMQDSMGYSLPVSDEALRVYSSLSSRSEISSTRLQGYVQDTYGIRTEAGMFTLTAGVRGSWWDFNRELIVSPRAAVRFIPTGNQRFVFRAASGLYYQSPFYKEFRMIVSDNFGNQTVELNRNIRSQRSIHFVGGGDFNFRMDGRPFRFTTEIYYKKMDRLVPYYVNNVRIQYYGENISRGHAAGLDLKLFGQFVPETDSWLSFSLMQARQTTFGGLELPMPTDQLYNFSLYFNDYFPNYRRVQLNMRAIWADGLPFIIPGHEYTKYIRTAPYRRVDVGMTYHIWDATTDARYAVLRHVRNVWLGLDVFNMLDINNISSYSWFADIEGYRHAIPDRLTGRQINVKLIVDF
jgi:hypothetical protein